jgi:hypothetical protein
MNKQGHLRHRFDRSGNRPYNLSDAKKRMPICQGLKEGQMLVQQVCDEHMPWGVGDCEGNLP